MKDNNENNMMKKIATFIVDKRKAFFVLFILASIYCATSISKVNVIEDLKEYLPETTETRQGVDIMDEEFITMGSGKVLIANITYEKALALSKELEEIKGVSSVKFYDADDEDNTYEDDELEEYYKDSAALFTFTMDEPEENELSQEAMVEIREKIADYDSYVYTTVDKDDSKSLKEDMKLILVIVVFIIAGVLLFTSTTYMEILIFMLTFGMAAILNMGTNYWFKDISFITNAVGVVLQLALAIDYAIILFHRFMEEKEHMETREALIEALSKAIPEISSSSLTTISGMVALMFMHFGIGMDLGRVLTKAIIFSMLSVFCFMPALIMMFNKAIDKTRHKNFVPDITFWGKFVVKTRYIFPPIFIIILIFGCIYANKCPYIFDNTSVESRIKNEYLASRDRIAQDFDTTNTLAIVLPKGDYQKEAEIISVVENIEEVDTVLGLANIEVGDDDQYVLTDSLTPRQFAEVADIDLDLSKLLYQAYAIDKEEYGAFMGSLDDYDIPVISMIDFIHEQKEKGGIHIEEKKSEDIDKMYDDVTDARKQLEGEEYSRIVLAVKGPVEGEETFKVVDQLHNIAQAYYDEPIYVVGDSTSDYDLSKSFSNDNTLISVLTALFVGIILLFTFQSVGLPFMLVLTIQGSIWITFARPYLMNSTMYFLSYLIVSSIQMGATIDYAIVITSRYMALRNTEKTKKDAIVNTLNQAFPTIITSGSIMTSAGFVIGYLTSNPVIASLGTTLGVGTLVSIILVMTVLPQILYVGDFIIDKTSFSMGSEGEKDSLLQRRKNMVRVNGHVKGYFCGTIDADVVGSLYGDMELTVKSDTDVIENQGCFPQAVDEIECQKKVNREDHEEPQKNKVESEENNNEENNEEE